RRIGEVWEVRYENEAGNYPERTNKYLGYIAALVARPNRSLTVQNLIGDRQGKLARSAKFTGEAETDSEGLPKMRGRLADIESLLELGGTEPLEEEKARLLEAIKRAERGKVITHGDPVRKAHHAISTRIRKFVREKLPKDMPRLASHLNT